MQNREGNILIIDDDPGVRQSLADIFAFKSYFVDTCSTGTSGLEQFVKGNYDAVLIDIQLPDMEGVEVLKAIKEKSSEIVCWIITGNATKDLAIKALQAGANDFLTKPLRVQEVLEKMEEALSDVLLRKQLKQTQEQYGLVIETVSNAIFQVDAKGIILYANPYAAFMFGYQENELLNLPITDLLHVKFHSSFSQLVQNCFSTSSSADITEQLYRCTGVCNGGEEIYLEISSGRVGDDQNSQLTLIIHDITKQKKAEEELFCKNKELVASGVELETALADLNEAYGDLKDTQNHMLQREKMASVGQLAAGVAHEINNPMGFITSNLITLRKYFDRLREFTQIQSDVIESGKGQADIQASRKKMKIDFILEDLPDLFEESLEGADRVKTIVLNLKSFSRMDEAQMASADINECLQATLNIVWNELKYTASVHRNYGDIPKILCYSHELSQVFLNILVNAGQAIKSQGIIRISTSEVDGYVYISIADNGAGIPAEKIEKIFDPFFTTKEVGKGTGLGLSISYDIIKKHNGELLVESVEGKGTTFTVKLPVKGIE